MPNLAIPPKLLPLVQKKKRIKVIIGGRGGGKSMTVADMFLMKMQTEGAKVLCLREFQNSIEESVHTLLKTEIDRMGLKGFQVSDKKIDIGGGGARFRGMARNAASIKSYHGFKYSWWEEAESASQSSLDLLLPTLRESDSECWFTANPKSSGDPFSQEFIVPYLKELRKHGYYEDKNIMIIVINWEDNPWFPDDLNDLRLSQKAKWSDVKYDHVWGGQFDDEVDNAIISASWFNAAIDAHVKLGFKPRGVKVVAHDPSDLGPDPKGMAVRHGVVITRCEEKDNGDVNEGCDWACDIAINENADVFIYDGDGIGAALRKQIDGNFFGKKIEAEMYKGSRGVDDPDKFYQPDDSMNRKQAKTNKETFKNKRSQRIWSLRDRFYNTYLAVEKGQYFDPDDLISISSEIEDIDGLRAECCRVPLKDNGSGYIQVMPKPEMKSKHDIDSPNRFDCLTMAFSNTPVKQKWASINIPRMHIA